MSTKQSRMARRQQKAPKQSQKGYDYAKTNKAKTGVASGANARTKNVQKRAPARGTARKNARTDNAPKRAPAEATQSKTSANNPEKKTRRGKKGNHEKKHASTASTSKASNANTAENGKKQTRQEQKKRQKEEKKANKRPVRRIFPIWLRLIVIPLLCAFALLVGMIIGYGMIGDGAPTDALRVDTWRHIIDIVNKSK